MAFIAFAPLKKVVWTLRLDDLRINFDKLMDFTITVLCVTNLTNRSHM